MFLDADLSSRSLTGDFTALRLADIIRVFIHNRASGDLTVTTNRGVGEIFFREGAVASAFYKDKIGQAALFDLLETSSLTFEFVPSTVSGPIITSLSTEEILAYCDALDAEWEFIAHQMPDWDVCLAWSLDGVTSAHLNALEWSVLRQVNGATPVRDILESLDYSEREILKSLCSLLKSGLIRPAGSAEKPSVEKSRESKWGPLRDRLLIYSFVIVTVPVVLLAILLTKNFTQENKRQFQEEIPSRLYLEQTRASQNVANQISSDTLLPSSEKEDTKSSLQAQPALAGGGPESFERQVGGGAYAGALADTHQKFDHRIKRSGLIITLWILTLSLTLVFIFGRHLFGSIH